MGPLTSDLLRRAAQNVGSELSLGDALEFSRRLSSRAFWSEEGGEIARVVPPLTLVPPRSRAVETPEGIPRMVSQRLQRGFLGFCCSGTSGRQVLPIGRFNLIML